MVIESPGLSGPQIRDLQQALMEALTVAELREVLRGRLDKILEHLVEPGPGETTFFNLVDKADRDGWARDLLVAALVENGNNARLAAVGKDLLTPTQQALVQLVPVLTEERRALHPHAAECYQSTKPPKDRGWEVPLPRYGDEVLNYAYQLACAPEQQDHTFPLVEFVRCLHRKAGNASAAARLDDWLRNIVPGVSPNYPWQAAPAPAPAAAAERYLLVQIVPLRTQPGRHTVQAWLVDARGRFTPLDGAEAVPRQEIPEQIEELRRQLDAKGVYLRDVGLELFLPLELLAEEVDQWVVQPLPEVFSPLGFEHRVVLRSLERAAGQGLRALLARWQRLPAPPGACAVVRDLTAHRGKKPVALWIETADWTPNELYLQVTGGDRAVVVCGLLDQPPAAGAGGRADILRVLLGAGVPVVLWVRNARKGLDLFSELRPLLHNKDLGSLPDRVWKLRRQAARQKDKKWHAGKHLTLVYDVPGRLPPGPQEQFQLKEPQ